MRIINTLFLLMLVILVSAIKAEVVDVEEDFLKQNYKPAPNPQGRVYTSIETADEEQRKEAAYDIETGIYEVKPFVEKPQMTTPDSPRIGTAQLAAEALYSESLENTLGVGPTAPTPYLDTTSYPWNTIYKLVMRFNVGGTDYYYNCSAWSAGNFHLVTAGHCIYNFDPNDDGDESDQKWADDVWAIPAQTDKVAPFDCGTGYCGDWPYGHARATHLRSYSGWTVDHNHDHDWGVITMDRNMGQRTGWMGRDSTPGASLNFSGYPVETPYVPDGTVVQYKGFDSNNVVSTTDFRIELSAFIYGGHSGGPSWKYVDGNRYVVGIHSTSNRVGSAHDTLLTTGKRTDLDNFMTADVTIRPPTNMVDITEYLFDGVPHKSISKTLVGKGEHLTMDYSVLNAGFTNLTNDIPVFIMASTNELISTSDTLIGSDLHSDDISTYTFRTFTSDVTIPNSLAAGDYTLGVLMSVNGEYGNELLCNGTACSNNIAVANQVLTVEDCIVDAYEDDEIALLGTVLNSGTPQAHNICATGDKDWYRFTIPSGDNADVVLRTFGTSGDTEMFLYRYNPFPTLELIESDDDSGPSLFSTIDRTCDTDPLSPGTYYVKVEEHLNNSRIAEYNMVADYVHCGDLIFKDGFE
ncbi:MAG: PPC domain-containing protein [Xanthomonadales bacterium]|jgi:V8-like Glu-specific endopeptidase|nr:PPC domain-containing protein [Xanthomonadales bacterium]